eukprot:sb/3470110/
MHFVEYNLPPSSRFMNVIEVIVIISYLTRLVLHHTLPDGGRVTAESGYLIPVSALITVNGFLRLFNIARYSELLCCLGTITISTVGYGDIAPKTVGGKFVGAALALLGLPLIAIPMPLIMSKFDSYYQNIKKKRKAVELKERLVREEQLMRELTPFDTRVPGGGQQSDLFSASAVYDTNNTESFDSEDRMRRCLSTPSLLRRQLSDTEGTVG